MSHFNTEWNVLIISISLYPSAILGDLFFVSELTTTELNRILRPVSSDTMLERLIRTLRQITVNLVFYAIYSGASGRVSPFIEELSSKWLHQFLNQCKNTSSANGGRSGWNPSTVNRDSSSTVSLRLLKIILMKEYMNIESSMVLQQIIISDITLIFLLILAPTVSHEHVFYSRNMESFPLLEQLHFPVNQRQKLRICCLS